MPANALVQTRIDPVVKERASAVLEELGITVSDAVRILLTRTANEGAVPFVISAKGAGVKPHEHYEMLRTFSQFLTWREGEAIILGEANVLPETDMKYFGVSGERM